ncbi:hypothetical protein E2I00_010114 [Balaenoptera physalus]|uniref:Uncharacterized protein n=1 Tax=Balaenoptera physalus TaxID=9770 RepID=A0A643CEV5_BALPH|nr:hypothetical protein E2I00_010114 [Balaenoptera physalus]
MPTMSRPALDVKGGTSPMKEDANPEMSSLAYSNLAVKDRKAVAILHYPGVTSNGTKANGAPATNELPELWLGQNEFDFTADFPSGC